jgi:hypothetical protein
MCEGQSAGLGTSDGDQQYVKGIFRVRGRDGPSNMATGSKSIDLRHLLIRSPRLEYRIASEEARQRFSGGFLA